MLLFPLVEDQSVAYTLLYIDQALTNNYEISPTDQQTNSSNAHGMKTSHAGAAPGSWRPWAEKESPADVNYQVAAHDSLMYDRML